MIKQTTIGPILLGVFIALILFSCTTMDTDRAAEETNSMKYKIEDRTRADVEAELPGVQRAFENAPDIDENRRAYAKKLFELGNVWQANEMITPLATPKADNLSDVELGAKLSLLTMDLDNAEMLYKRLIEISEKDSKFYNKAVKGLQLVYFQSNDYTKIRDITLSESEKEGTLHFDSFLKKFEDEPYVIEWTSADKTGHMPFLNDITEPGVLPIMKVTVNGHPLEFLLDTGGANLYIDYSLVEIVGVKTIQKTRNKYAYTNGEYVDEILGSVETVELEGVTINNVPVHVGQLRSRGQDIDGIVTTQFLKQFLSTIDYENNEITLRERSKSGKAQFLESMEGRNMVEMPFFMTGPHLMFAKGSINGHDNLNMFMDSGLASAQEAIITNETADLLGLKKEEISGIRYYTAPVDSVALEGLASVTGQVLGNVFVEENPYWSRGFVWDGLISHQYLWTLGSWTIDFDTMTYYFPAKAKESLLSRKITESKSSAEKIKLDNPESYIGSYEVAPGTDLVITAEDGVLMLQAPGQNPIGIDAFDDGTFGISLAGVVIEFLGSPETEITGLKMIQGTNVTKAVKK